MKNCEHNEWQPSGYFIDFDTDIAYLVLNCPDCESMKILEGRINQQTYA